MKPMLHIAEGDAELCQIYERFLTARGYDVHTSTDGLDCLEKLRRRLPDVLLLDLELCWGGSEGVLAWLREERDVPLVPVVLTATAGAPQQFSELFEAPVVQCLQKPFALAALLESVRVAAAQGQPGPRQGSCELAFPERFIG